MILGVQLMLPPAAPPSEPPGLAARRQRPVTVPPVPEYAAILASPIFAPDRRPGAAGTASEGGGGSLNGYAAIGAVAGRAVASAVVTLPGGGIKTLRLGDEVEGWRLVGVDRTHVYFERNGLRHVLVVGAPPETSPPQEGNAETPGAATPTVNP
jgi:hypothetical protein